MAWMKNQGCEINGCNEEGIALRTRCKSIVVNFPNKEIRVARPEVSPKTVRFGGAVSHEQRDWFLRVLGETNHAARGKRRRQTGQSFAIPQAAQIRRAHV